MRWWDRGVRVRVFFLMLQALALGVVAEGGIRILAVLGSAVAGLLLVRSMNGERSPAKSVLKSAPHVKGSFYLGQGFEWTLEALQESIEKGQAARRTERPLLLSEAMLDQHLLILGTTGVGKTRMLELLILQAVERGDAVVVIDPKGDDRMLARVRGAAGHRFRLFS